MKEITEELFSYIIYSGPTGTPPPRDLDKIKSFIDQGAELNKIDSIFKRDLLTCVIRNTKSKRERLATIKLLVDSGARINFKNKIGPSPINSALDCLDYRVTKFLLENGAIILPQRDLYASKIIEKDNIKFFELLLEHGLDINAPTSYSYMAGANDDIEIPGNSLLIDAVVLNAINIVKCLIENNADIHYSHPFSGSALARAIYYNNTEALELLLEAGGNPNEIIFPGNIPVLRNAISRGHLECVKLLLKYGAKIEDAYVKEDLENLNIPRDVARQIEELLT
ncbi:ankyrin repeat domain-containing protein [Flavivirga algicola]|uniref:Ankyrin repeat domain-containing protein n=1 Tax=Flavivirga algicola TaxID=2729136 RepID=A0ABX1RZ15_9FLAO|nr:ankyrin repeat domain-containing protein [Flavivirga algicola]NMH88826.1 hypothetical protein [Flavivirga algicola]